MSYNQTVPQETPQDDQMRPIAQALGQLMRRQALRIRDLIQMTGIPRATISRHVNDKTVPSLEDRRRYAKAFGMESLEFEQYWRVGPPRKPGYIAGSSHRLLKGTPIINKVRAGQPHDYQDVGAEHYDQIEAPPEALCGDPDAFAVQIVGDSMAPKYLPGDRVICSPRSDVGNGDACFLQFYGDKDGQNTFKRVYDLGDGTMKLVADNERYKPEVIALKSLARIVKAVYKLSQAP